MHLIPTQLSGSKGPVEGGWDPAPGVERLDEGLLGSALRLRLRGQEQQGGQQLRVEVGLPATQYLVLKQLTVVASKEVTKRCRLFGLTNSALVYER